MLETFTRETFVDCMGSTFRVVPGAAAPVEVELIAATALSARPAPAGAPPPREPFSLVFRGPRAAALRQGTHTLEHPKLGTFPLFIVPIVPDERGPRYEAIFN